MGFVVAGLRMLLGPLLTGMWTALGTFLVQGLLMGGLVVVGWYFRDGLFDLLAEVVGYVVSGLNGVGLNIPTLGEVLTAFPEGVLIFLKRVAFDEFLAILLTAASVKALLGLFKWVRALNVVGG